MKTKVATAFLTGTISFGLPLCVASAAPADAKPAAGVDREKATRMVAKWSERPRLAAAQMMAKYGNPSEATAEYLIWRDKGPFARIKVQKLEIPHDFPKPHMDYLTHTVRYRVPADKTDELVAFDGSVIPDRTAGELSARCDLEGHNILTLNLANDIVNGKKNVADARKDFGAKVAEDSLGKMPAYVTALQFAPGGAEAADADKSVMPGSPVRPDKAKPAAGTEAEALGLIVALNENEILAAAEAQSRALSEPVLDYARMLHSEHGANLMTTMKLGQTLATTPVETEAVDMLRRKGAGELAQLTTLTDRAFEKAYVAAMIKGHAEALSLIDGQLSKSAKTEGLRAHLGETRTHIAAHLETAKKIKMDSKLAKAPLAAKTP